jgi:hypothetical protein
MSDNHAIRPYLIEQMRLHPSMTPGDLAKLCYQAARGAEHLLADPQRARAYLHRELEATEACGEIPLYELISPEIARVNLAAWKARGLDEDRLFEMFLATVNSGSPEKDRLPAYLDEVGALLSEGEYPVDPTQWAEFRRRYEEAGMPAVHHSDEYRAQECPAYRIVRVGVLEAYLGRNF